MKIREVIREKQNRFKKTILGAAATGIVTAAMFPQTVMASGVSDVTQPLMNLKTLLSVLSVRWELSFWPKTLWNLPRLTNSRTVPL